MPETNSKPQLNKNFTMFYNKMLDNIIASKFGPLELRVILAIIRKTDGYHIKEAEISLRMFGKMTKTNHWNIHKVIKKLVDAEIIYQTKGAKMKYGKSVHKYSINEESYHRWNTRAGVMNATETGVKKTPIKYKKKKLKESIKSLVDKLNINK